MREGRWLQKQNLNGAVEGWKEPNKITEIDFLLALPVRKLLEGQQFEEKYDYEHPEFTWFRKTDNSLLSFRLIEKRYKKFLIFLRGE